MYRTAVHDTEIEPSCKAINLLTISKPLKPTFNNKLVNHKLKSLCFFNPELEATVQSLFFFSIFLFFEMKIMGV